MKTSGTFDDECARLGAEFGTKMNDGERVSLVIATVSAIDEDAKTLEAVVDNDRIFSDISLNIFPNGGNSLYIIPSVNSLVVLGFIESYSEVPVLIKATKIDKMVVSNVAGTEEEGESTISFDKDAVEIIRGTSSWRIEKNKISFTADKIEMDGGENGGLVLVDGVTTALNNLVTQVGNMCTVFNAHTHGAQGASPPATPMTAPSQFNKGDYENTKITQ